MKEYKLEIPNGRPLTKDTARSMADRLRGALAVAIATHYKGEKAFDPKLVRVVNALSVEYPDGYLGKPKFIDSETQFKIRYNGQRNLGDLTLEPDGTKIIASLLLTNYWHITEDTMKAVVEQIKIELSGRV